MGQARQRHIEDMRRCIARQYNIPSTDPRLQSHATRCELYEWRDIPWAVEHVLDGFEQCEAGRWDIATRVLCQAYSSGANRSYLTHDSLIILQNSIVDRIRKVPS